MKNVYAPTYQAIKTAQVIEAAELGGQDYLEAQVKLAAVAHDAYEHLHKWAAFRHASRPEAPSAGLAIKEAMAVEMVELALDVRDAHIDSGSKVASDPAHLADVMHKLAAAVFVDEVISEQLPMLEGPTKEAAVAARSLGREYVLSLIGELLG